MSKVQRHRAAGALAALTGLPFAACRRRVAECAGDTVSAEDLEAYLRTTFRLDPTGVTAVRNAMRGAA